MGPHAGEDMSSSPDPIALSPPPSQARRSSPLRRASSNSIRKQSQPSTPTRYVSSPSKTITMSTGKSAGAKPWTIKVTVEAEPESTEGNEENIGWDETEKTSRGRGRTIKVPLRDHDDSPTTTSKPRSRTPASKKTKRAGTPVRRKRRSVTNIDSDEGSQDDSRDRDFTPKPRARRGRRKTSISNLIFDEEESALLQNTTTDAGNASPEAITIQHDEVATTPSNFLGSDVPSPPTFSSISPPATTPGAETTENMAPLPSTDEESPSRAKGHSDTALSSSNGRIQTKPSASSSAPDISAAYPKFNFTKLPNACSEKQDVGLDAYTNIEESLGSEDSDSGDEIEPTEAEVGDRTMMESEGFSMISLESLESARDMLHISSPGRSVTASSPIKDNSPPKADTSQDPTNLHVEEHPSGLLTPSTSSVHGEDVVFGNSYLMRSSPPRPQTKARGTPINVTRTPSNPPELAPTASQHKNVGTPALQKAATLTQALQGAVASPKGAKAKIGSTPSNDVGNDSLFHGFSANTRKQLRDGFQLGEKLAQQPSNPVSPAVKKATDSVRYPCVSPQARTAVEVPGLTIPPPPGKADDALYPSMSPVRGQNRATKIVPSYDEMSWKPTTPAPGRPACVSPDSMEAQWQRDRENVSRQIQEADPSEVIVVPEEEDDSVSELQTPDAQAEQQVQEKNLSSSTTSCRRPKLSRTWRRRSSGGFAYRNEPPLGSSPQRPGLDRAPTTFWQPGTSQAVLNSSAPSAASSRRASNGFRRSVSGSSGGSSTPTPSPPAEEIQNPIEEILSTSDEELSTPPESPDEGGSVVSDDTGLFWHRNLPSVYSKDRSEQSSSNNTTTRLKSDKIDLSSLLKLQTPIDISPLRTPGRGLETPARNVSAFTALTPGAQLHTPGLRGVLKTPGSTGTWKGSPLKSASRVSFAAVDEVNDISIDGTTESEDSDIRDDASYNISDTMSSDVRQLHEEMLASDSSNMTTSEDETANDDVQETEEELDSSEINELSQSISQYSAPSGLRDDISEATEISEQEEQTDTSNASARSSSTVRQPSNSYSRLDATIVRDVQEQDDSVSESHLVNRVSAYFWSFVPSGSKTPSDQLSHPVLKDKFLSLLPRIEPWTKTHYKILDRLYQKYKKRPHLFDPDHPDNKCLKPLIMRKQRYRAGPEKRVQDFSFADWIGAEMKNWGYSVTLSHSHIVLAALYSQLLVLQDIAEYEQLVGEEINLGNCNAGMEGDELGVDKIVFRLFSIIHGEMVRADEKIGKKVDRKKGTGWVRFKGSDQWISYM